MLAAVLVSLIRIPLVAAIPTVTLQQASYAKQAAKPSRAVTSTKTSKKATKNIGTTDNKIQRFLLALAPQDMSDIQMSPEERADADARSKEYSRQKMAQHR